MWNFVGIAGTVIEFIGFVLLSLDLLPEYSLHKKRRALYRFATFMDDPDWISAKRSREKDAARESIDPLKLSLDDLALNLAMSPHYSVLDLVALKPSTLKQISAEEFNQYIEKGRGILEERERRLAQRWRPPIILGIFVVGLGVLIQIVGQVPGTIRCSILHASFAGPIACEGVEMTTQ